jgi:hypothetical protein
MVDAPTDFGLQGFCCGYALFWEGQADRKDKPRVAIGAKMFANMLKQLALTVLDHGLMRSRFKVSSMYR